MSIMTRGQLARRCGVGAETIRFYERQGLLPEAPRSGGGYRRFDTQAVNRLVFIRRAKGLGFSLPEIRELLSLADNPGGDRARVKQITKSKLQEIEAKIKDLEHMRSTLSELARQCSGRGHVKGCPIIEAIADQARPDTSRVKEERSATRRRHG